MRQIERREEMVRKSEIEEWMRQMKKGGEVRENWETDKRENETDEGEKLEMMRLGY